MRRSCSQIDDDTFFMIDAKNNDNETKYTKIAYCVFCPSIIQTLNISFNFPFHEAF